MSLVRKNAINSLSKVVEKMIETGDKNQDYYLALEANKWLNYLNLDTNNKHLNDLKTMLEDLQPHNNVAVVTWNDSKINQTFEFISLEEMDEQEFENWVKWFVGSDGTIQIH
jgi:hypothetical protein